MCVLWLWSVMLLRWVLSVTCLPPRWFFASLEMSQWVPVSLRSSWLIVKRTYYPYTNLTSLDQMISKIVLYFWMQIFVCELCYSLSVGLLRKMCVQVCNTVSCLVKGWFHWELKLYLLIMRLCCFIEHFAGSRFWCCFIPLFILVMCPCSVF